MAINAGYTPVEAVMHYRQELACGRIDLHQYAAILRQLPLCPQDILELEAWTRERGRR